MPSNPSLKGHYIADNGSERFTIDFFWEKERDKACLILEAWDDRIKTLMVEGHDFVKNGYSLAEMGDVIEGRIRVLVGGQIIEWAELLLFEAKDHPMDKQLNRLDEMISTLAGKVGKTVEELKSDLEKENEDGNG